MAYSDYGGYVYRNRQRIEERSDWAPDADGVNLGKPGVYPGLVAVMEKGMSPEEYQRRAAGPGGHAVLGTGPVYVTLCKDYYVLVHHGRDEVLYMAQAWNGPQSTGERQTTQLRLGGRDGPVLTLITETHPTTRDQCLYAELKERPNDAKPVIWTGWTGAQAGAGWDRGDEHYNPGGVANTRACDERMRELLWNWNEPEHETVQWSEQCGACEGTGLVSGLLEAAGAAVVCQECKGAGGISKSTTHTPFTIRFPRPDVDRVFECNPGVPLTPQTPGGARTEDWEDDPESTKRAGAEAREAVCPAWWYQSADHERKPDWKECGETDKFRDCPLFDQKTKCWQRFDREEGAENPADNAETTAADDEGAPEG